MLHPAGAGDCRASHGIPGRGARPQHGMNAGRHLEQAELLKPVNRAAGVERIRIMPAGCECGHGDSLFAGRALNFLEDGSDSRVLVRKAGLSEEYEIVVRETCGASQ